MDEICSRKWVEFDAQMTTKTGQYNLVSSFSDIVEVNIRVALHKKNICIAKYNDNIRAALYKIISVSS